MIAPLLIRAPRAIVAAALTIAPTQTWAPAPIVAEGSTRADGWISVTAFAPSAVASAVVSRRSALPPIAITTLGACNSRSAPSPSSTARSVPNGATGSLADARADAPFGAGSMKPCTGCPQSRARSSRTRACPPVPMIQSAGMSSPGRFF